MTILAHYKRTSDNTAYILYNDNGKVELTNGLCFWNDDLESKLKGLELESAGLITPHVLELLNQYHPYASITKYLNEKAPQMLKAGDKITVHFINHWCHTVPTEEATENTGKEYTVKEQHGKLGFDGNERRSPYTCRGELFTPFQAYAQAVIFKNIETGRLYRYNEIYKDLQDVTDLNDDYMTSIKWLEQGA